MLSVSTFVTYGTYGWALLLFAMSSDTPFTQLSIVVNVMHSGHAEASNFICSVAASLALLTSIASGGSSLALLPINLLQTLLHWIRHYIIFKVLEFACLNSFWGLWHIGLQFHCLVDCMHWSCVFPRWFLHMGCSKLQILLEWFLVFACHHHSPQVNMLYTYSMVGPIMKES